MGGLRLKLGIIGCGYITKKHWQAISEVDQIEVCALSDLSRDRMNDIADQIEYDQKRSVHLALYSDYKEMLRDPALDVILVATSSGVHAEITRRVLEAGKHVIVEKPLALSLSESRSLSRLAKEKKRSLLVCYQRRFMKSMMKIKEIIQLGQMGEIYYGIGTLTVNRSQEYYEQVPWRGTWHQDGGMLINQGIHTVDLLMWLFGNLSHVSSSMMRVKPYKEIEDIAFGMLHFTNGARGMIEVSTVSLPENNDCSLRVFAEKGVITIRGSSLDRIESFEVVDAKIDLEALCADGLERVRMYEAYTKHILGGECSDCVDGPESEKALEAIFALYQSELSQCPVQLPLQAFSTTQMQNHFVD